MRERNSGLVHRVRSPGMKRLGRAVGAAFTVARVAEENDVKYPAAALAYYAFVSQIPLLVLVLAVFGDRLIARIQVTTPAFLTPNARQLMYEALTTASGRAGAALLAVVVLAWSGANIVVGFQTVVDRVEPGVGGSLLGQLRDAGSILGSFGLVIVAIVLTNVVFALLPNSWIALYGEPVVQFSALTIAFLPLYYAPSRVVTSPSDALPGALTAAFGWTVLLTVVQFYAANASRYALYGVLSGIIIILTGLYVAAVVLMVGVVVNTVIADEGDTPDPPPA